MCVHVKQAGPDLTFTPRYENTRGGGCSVCVCVADAVLLMGKSAGHLVLNSSKPAVAIEQNTVCEEEEEEEDEYYQQT